MKVQAQAARGAQRERGRGQAAAGRPLYLIHTNNCSNPILARLPAGLADLFTFMLSRGADAAKSTG